LDGLIDQRRRWNNGAFFAMIYSITHFGQFWQHSSHSFGHKMLMTALFFYYCLTMLLSWFGVGLFYLTFYILVRGTIGDIYGGAIFLVPQITFILIGVTNIIYGLGTKPRHVAIIYYICAIMFALLMALTLGCMGFQVIAGWNRFSLLEKVGTCITIFANFVAALLHGEIIPVMLSYIQYVLLLPTFQIVLTIYSWCNTHDFSWGTKGLDRVQPTAHGATGEARREAESKAAQLEAQRNQDQANREKFRCLLLLAWLVTNGGLIGGFMFKVGQQLESKSGALFTQNDTARQFAIIIFYIAGVINAVRFVGSMIFLFQKLVSFLVHPRKAKLAAPAPRSAIPGTAAANARGVAPTGNTSATAAPSATAAAVSAPAVAEAAHAPPVVPQFGPPPNAASGTGAPAIPAADNSNAHV